MLKSKIRMFVLAIALCFYVVSATAQEFTLKKDIILKDKVPYAKLTGESSLFKETDLLVSSLQGDPLFTIKAWKYPTGNPVYEELKGVKIEFKTSGKSLVRPTTKYNKSKLVEEIFHFWSDLIVNNAIDPKAEADYISKFDSNAVVLAKMYEETESDYIKKMMPIKRDTTAAIEVKLISDTKTPQGSIIQETEIYQGGVYLMSIKKLWTSECVFSCYRNVKEAMPVLDTETKKIQIATLTMPSYTLTYGGDSKLFTNMDTKTTEIRITNFKESEKQITRSLIKLGYL